jgi:hypothetical protein
MRQRLDQHHLVDLDRQLDQTIAQTRAACPLAVLSAACGGDPWVLSASGSASVGALVE